MWLSRMFSVVTGKRKPCPHAELLQRAVEFEMEGKADPAEVARTIRIMGGSDSYRSVIYGSDGSQMGRRTIRLLIGTPGPSIMEAVMLRAASGWIRRQTRRFR